MDYCSAGVFDNGKIEDAFPTAFSYNEFFNSTEGWGWHTERSFVEYEKSAKIQYDNIDESVFEFTISPNLSGSRRMDLEDVITKHATKSVNGNLICIHSQSAHCYYARAAKECVRRSHSRAYRRFPYIIVITPTVEDAILAMKTLTKPREGHYIQRVSADLIAQTLNFQPRSKFQVKILVGTADELAEYVRKMDDANLLEKLQDTVTQIYLLKSELMSSNDQFLGNVREVFAVFKYTAANFVIMFNFLEATCSILEFRKILVPLIAKSVFFEVEKTKPNKFFQSVDILPVVSISEYTDRLMAYKEVGTEKIEDTVFSAVKLMQTSVIQKLDHLRSTIKTVRDQRKKKNQERNLSRPERILVITKDSQTTIFVTMYLKGDQLEVEEPRRYSVHKITEEDSMEHIEVRNHEFRSSDLDVLIIDWRSLRFVNRGTIDSLIFFDTPEPDYFQTVLELEIQNLVSIRSNFLPRIFILFDKTTDECIVHELAKFFYKYNVSVPEWFSAYYESFYDRMYSK